MTSHHLPGSLLRWEFIHEALAGLVKLLFGRLLRAGVIAECEALRAESQKQRRATSEKLVQQQV